MTAVLQKGTATRKRGCKPYLWIRISKANWKQLHVHLWEQAYGKIPKGMLIVFKDRDTMNCVLENLEMITREENMKRNTFHNYPKEIASLVQLGGVLTRQINKKLKNLL